MIYPKFKCKEECAYPERLDCKFEKVIKDFKKKQFKKSL